MTSNNNISSLQI